MGIHQLNFLVGTLCHVTALGMSLVMQINLMYVHPYQDGAEIFWRGAISNFSFFLAQNVVGMKEKLKQKIVKTVFFEK